MTKNDPYAKFSINYPDHPKVAGLSDAAFRAHVEMILYAARYETDGRIAKRVAKRWADDAVAELCSNDDERPSLIELDSGDYMLHGYGDSQTLKADIEAKRAVNRENARLGGLAKKRNTKQDAKRTASETAQWSASETLSENVPEVRSKKLEVIPPTVPQAEDLSQWKPTAKHYEYGKEIGVFVKDEAEKFKAHAEKNDRDLKNINLAFTNWLKKLAPKNHPSTLSQSELDDRRRNPWKYA